MGTRSRSMGSTSGRSSGGRAFRPGRSSSRGARRQTPCSRTPASSPRTTWEKDRFPWLAGEIAARYLVQSRIVEWWVHGEDMRATNGLGTRVPALADPPDDRHGDPHAAVGAGRSRTRPHRLQRPGRRGGSRRRDRGTGASAPVRPAGRQEARHHDHRAGAAPRARGGAPAPRRRGPRLGEPRHGARRGARRHDPAPHPRVRLRRTASAPARTPCVNGTRVPSGVSDAARASSTPTSD